MLAVLKSGAGYLPLDPDYPGARLGFMVGDSGARCLLSSRDHAGSLVVAEGAVLPPTLCLDDADLAARLRAYPAGPVSDGERCAPLQPEHLAYLIYTSGSTGTPKGVGNSPWGNLVNQSQLDTAMMPATDWFRLWGLTEDMQSVLMLRS